MIIKESITINSTLERVWDTFSDLSCWTQWNTVIKDVRSEEQLLKDGNLLKCTFRPFLFPIRVMIRIEEMVPYEYVLWVARKKGLVARHEFLFQPGGKGVLVTSRETFTGFLAAGAGFFLPVRKMRNLTRDFLIDLKQASEGQ